MDIKSATIEQLEKEIRSRKNPIPPMVENPSIDSIVELINKLNSEIVDLNYVNDDNKQWIFEGVIDALYGQNKKEYYNWYTEYM